VDIKFGTGLFTVAGTLRRKLRYWPGKVGPLVGRYFAVLTLRKCFDGEGTGPDACGGELSSGEKLMKRHTIFALVVLVVGLFGFILVPSASANTWTYTYTGRPMGLDLNPYTGTPDICGGSLCTWTGSFTVATPLGDNFGAAIPGNTPFSNIVPLSFQFTDGFQTITTGATNFGITTGPTGAISTWFVKAGTVPGGYVAVEDIGSNGFGDEDYPAAATILGPAVFNFAPGTWTGPTPTTTPEPSSLLLLGTGILGLALLLRKRQGVHSQSVCD